MKTFICMDFDGTLVDKAEGIHPADVAMLREGHDDAVFIPATGRPLHGVRQAFNEAGLFLNEEILLPMVLLNGATTFLPGEEIFRFTPFPVATTGALIKMALKYATVSAFFFSFDGLDIVYPNTFSDSIVKRFGLNDHLFNEDRTPPRYAKMMAVSEDTEALAEIAKGLPELAIEWSFSLPTVLEVNVKGVNKGQVALDLIDALGHDDHRIIAVGDGENDLPLFDIADKIFVPEDSPDAIKARADYVIDPAKAGLLAPILKSLEG